MPTEPIQIFVVGFPRSGTTLLQSMLAAHPSVLALPETHALWGLEPRNPLLRRAGFRSKGAVEVWSRLPEMGVPVPGPTPRRIGGYIRTFVNALDRAALDAGRAAWSEKTPGHLRSVPLIEAHAPRAHVVHLVRRGLPAVTSLFAVTREHSDEWSGPRSLPLCLTSWCRDLERTADASRRPRQHVVAYEALVDDPGRVLARLVERLALPGDAETSAATMIDGYRDRAAAVASAGEVWKAGAALPLIDRNQARTGILTDAETDFVRRGVAAREHLYASLPYV